MQKYFVLLFLLGFMFLGEDAQAIPNPASSFCEDQGYTLRIMNDKDGQYGVCVFNDGKFCEEWAFFKEMCGKEYIKSTSCVEAGNPVKTGKCCVGLSTISAMDLREDYRCRARVGGWGVCSDCGNGTCETWENPCNCFQDCSANHGARVGQQMLGAGTETTRGGMGRGQMIYKEGDMPCGIDGKGCPMLKKGNKKDLKIAVGPDKEVEVISNGELTEKIRSQIKIDKIEKIELNNILGEPYYIVYATEEVKIWKIFSGTKKLSLKVDAITGEIKEVKKSWFKLKVW